MGTEISVASVVYNLAGEEAQRPQYRKTLVIQQLFSKKNQSMADALLAGLLKGPAMKLRSFYRWASEPTNYDQIGMPSGSIRNTVQPTAALVEPAIPRDIDETVDVTSVSLGQGNARFWAERWILDNRSADYGLTWSYQIDPDGNFITIIFPSGSPTPLIEVIPAVSPAFNPSTWYIYANYLLTTPGVADPVDPLLPPPLIPPDPPAPVITQRRFIYAAGSGDAALDELVSDATSYGEFFPFIPVRLDNQFLSSSYLPSAYAQATKAFKKVLDGADFEELKSRINDNPDVGAVDHAYVVLGVSLNVVEKECRKYLYAFFNRLRAIQQGGTGAYDDWIARGQTATPLNNFKVTGTTSVASSYNMQMGWRFVTERSATGLGRTGAKSGDLWFSKSGYVGGQEVLRLYWQRTDSTFTYLELVGMYHQNFVYGSTAVTIYAFQAIDDLKESGFLVPLHYDIWRRTNLVATSQMATACVFVVFNCFQVYVTEVQWWQSWWFQFFLIIVIAVVSVVFTGGAGLGLLGAPLTIGASLGFTGITAIIVGAAINGLAAMVLVSLIEPLVKQVAGEYAPIVMAVLMFAIGQAAGSLQAGGTLAINWTDLLRADNLLAMTNAIGQTVTNQFEMDSLKIQNSSMDYLDKAQAEMEKIQQAFYDEFGYGNAIVDPLAFTDPSKSGSANESASTFLTRTLMTGSEIAEMSRQLLYEFPTYSLKLPDAFT